MRWGLSVICAFVLGVVGTALTASAQTAKFQDTFKVPAGIFTNCLKTKESSSLESGVEEKLYAPAVGLLKDGAFELARIEKLEVDLTRDGNPAKR